MKRIDLDTPRLYLIEDFFSPQECDDLIIRSEQTGFEEAQVQVDGKQVMLKGIRNNSRILFTDVDLAKRIWNRFKPYAVEHFENRIASGLNELFRIYKYEPDQHFKKHRDGSFVRNETEASLFTLLIYLNDDFEGGETSFDRYTVKPKRGTALVFYHPLKHTGETVLSGVKYALRTDVMYTLQS